jgi:hypothetical protein
MGGTNWVVWPIVLIPGPPVVWQWMAQILTFDKCIFYFTLKSTMATVRDRGRNFVAQLCIQWHYRLPANVNILLEIYSVT